MDLGFRHLTPVRPPHPCSLHLLLCSGQGPSWRTHTPSPTWSSHSLPLVCPSSLSVLPTTKVVHFTSEQGHGPSPVDSLPSYHGPRCLRRRRLSTHVTKYPPLYLVMFSPFSWGLTGYYQVVIDLTKHETLSQWFLLLLTLTTSSLLAFPHCGTVSE